MSDGLTVMIHKMYADKQEGDPAEPCYGKVIRGLELAEDSLTVTFDGQRLVLWDAGQSCCESRYMRTDDDLSIHVGQPLTKVELRQAPEEPDEYGNHEVEFLLITSGRGTSTVASHNEHNGYYGGFLLTAKVETIP